MREAFERAGYVTAEDRLREIMLRLCRDDPPIRSGPPVANAETMTWLRSVAMAAVQDNRRDWDGAKAAFFKEIRNDADLLWALFAPYRDQAAQRLLAGISDEIRATERLTADQKRERGLGHLHHGDQRIIAQPANQSWGQNYVANQKVDAPSSRAAMDAVSRVARLSLLDTFKANGKSIGDMTPDEANAWAGSRERDARFVRLLTANLPGHEPIRKFRTPDETQALYAQAQEAAHV